MEKNQWENEKYGNMDIIVLWWFQVTSYKSNEVFIWNIENRQWGGKGVGIR